MSLFRLQSWPRCVTIMLWIDSAITLRTPYHTPYLHKGNLYMPITPEAMMQFAEDNDIVTLEDLEDFTEWTLLLWAEPNVPLLVIN